MIPHGLTPEEYDRQQAWLAQVRETDHARGLRRRTPYAVPELDDPAWSQHPLIAEAEARYAELAQRTDLPPVPEDPTAETYALIGASLGERP